MGGDSGWLSDLVVFGDRLFFTCGYIDTTKYAQVRELRSISLDGEDEETILSYGKGDGSTFKAVAVIDDALNVLVANSQDAPDGASYAYELLQIDESGNVEVRDSFAGDYIYSCFITADELYYSVGGASGGEGEAHGQVAQRSLGEGDTVLYEGSLGSIDDLVEYDGQLLFSELASDYKSSRICALSLSDGNVSVLYDGLQSEEPLAYLSTMADGKAYLECSDPSDSSARFSIKSIDLLDGTVEDVVVSCMFSDGQGESESENSAGDTGDTGEVYECKYFSVAVPSTWESGWNVFATAIETRSATSCSTTSSRAGRMCWPRSRPCRSGRFPPPASCPPLPVAGARCDTPLCTLLNNLSLKPQAAYLLFCKIAANIRTATVYITAYRARGRRRFSTDARRRPRRRAAGYEAEANSCR